MIKVQSDHARQSAAGGKQVFQRLALPYIDPAMLYDVTMEEGVFTAIQPAGEAGAERATAALWPGYTECHAHMALPPNFDDSVDDPAIVALQYLYHGVTHIVDMFGFPLVQKRWRQAAHETALPFPEIAHCAYAVTTMCGLDGKGGHGTEFPSPVFMLGCLADLDTILHANRSMGATFLKIMFTGGVEQPGGVPKFSRLSTELLAGLARATQAQGLDCVLDCTTREEVMLAWRMGFRYFAHAVRDVELSEADWQSIPGAKFVSTLSGLRPMILRREEFLDEYGRPSFAQTQDAANIDFVSGIEQPFGIARNCQESRTQALSNIRRNSIAAMERGALLVGTDSGNTGGFHGYSLLGEVRLLDEQAEGCNHRLQTAATVGGRGFFDRMAGRKTDLHPIRVGAEATFNLFTDVHGAAGSLPSATYVRGAQVDRTKIVEIIGALRTGATRGKVSL
ncbi:hydrolase [Chitinimonas arctica]|uniref:Hydrolase n=1 Tax=Chitinimonas arctica TaxID=2594795 RepID=A0A516SBF1_9NEIS|nr:hydrolase [Chitinimonas arctica]QDQ25474.1 hydrolase [Chitinimonas arctica]